MKTQDTIRAVRAWLDKHGLNSSFDEDESMLCMDCKLQGELGNVFLVFRFFDEGYTVLAVSPVPAAPENSGELATYLHLVNYGIMGGNWEMNLDNGDIRFRYWVPTSGLRSLPAKIVEGSVFIPICMFELYGDGLAALLRGESDARSEYAKVSGK